MTINITIRNRQSELMDDPSLDSTIHRRALAGLRRINWWSRTDNAIWKEILTLSTRNSTARPLSILDIAAGGGDLAIRLAELAERDSVPVRIDGCDISPTALSYATNQAATAQRSNVKFFQCDALQQPFPQSQYDVVM